MDLKILCTYGFICLKDCKKFHNNKEHIILQSLHRASDNPVFFVIEGSPLDLLHNSGAHPLSGVVSRNSQSLSGDTAEKTSSGEVVYIEALAIVFSVLILSPFFSFFSS